MRGIEGYVIVKGSLEGEPSFITKTAGEIMLFKSRREAMIEAFHFAQACGESVYVGILYKRVSLHIEGGFTFQAEPMLKFDRAEDDEYAQDATRLLDTKDEHVLPPIKEKFRASNISAKPMQEVRRNVIH